MKACDGCITFNLYSYNKAKKSLNFLRRNLSKCSINVKENAYLTIVRPLLEYAACVWDPYQEYLLYDLEKIQRRAARWVLSNYKLAIIAV